MNITVDCRMIDSSGIGVYIRECLPYIVQSGHKVTLLGEVEKLQGAIEGFSNAEILACSVKPFSLEELFMFPASLKKAINRTDLFYSPYFNIPGGLTVPVYTTIHDMVFADMPGLVSKLGLSIRKFFLQRAMKRSVKIFTVSNFSKSRIEHHLGAAKQIIVTHSAIQPAYLEHYRNKSNGNGGESEARLSGRSAQSKRRTIIYIGNIKKHKGLSYLIEAFIAAVDRGMDYRLLIIGSADKFRTKDDSVLRKIQTEGRGRIEFTGFISQLELIRLTSEAALLVQPSLYEGFCLPPLEALTLGTRVLISDIPVLREIYADYPVEYFRAGDAEDLKNKMEALLKDTEPLGIELPKSLAERYTFDKTAQAILGALP